MDVRIVDDPARVVADLLVDVACAGGHVALAGGSTPRRAYEMVAEGDADLSAATLWLGDERVVDVHVRNLRRALGDDASAPSIVATVRGVGYKFVAAPA